MTKRNNSLTRINNPHYTSPYEKKSASTDKNKAVTAFLAKTGRSTSLDNMKLKVKNNDGKLKEAIISNQMLKFQNSIPYHSTPNSPSSRKVPRPEIKVTKADNILTIRKKKLDALK